ncbi:lipopolysaccharide assembly protein LapB [Williamsia sp. CHRR-6]|uniref:tetratricopeptide repeat protein n=1 Tax=Williamsia sp. CHRR-6 TaxID=2835871 RepID=UPI001BDB11A9|nr:tetratricopeptide repeat protein [Williamsia sp. CHRR-6]MBT0566733.1 DUF4062 domain-containing protein [Williamsia sp. CHRR-6]
MTSALPLHVFIATPGDLGNERAVVRSVISQHNALQSTEASCFKLVGWESVRATAQRPQEAINELIGECHFMLVLFRKSWGSEPGSPWGYTSGTEEELFTGLLQLGQDHRLLRDIWVAFIDEPERDPKITQLQDQMKKTHSLMYETIQDTAALKCKLSDRLGGWVSHVGSKVARHVDLIPSSGRDLLQASRCLRDGEKLIELGQLEAGRGQLRRASEHGGPPEQLAYAKCLEHAGELDAAQGEVQKVIDYFAANPGTLHTPAAANAFAALAGISRRRGAKFEAISQLEHALTLVSGDDRYSSTVRCRISDELGLAHQKVEELDAAAEQFEASRAERDQLGDEQGRCQSLVNLARVHVARGDLDSAQKCADDALLGLNGFPSTALHANAEILRAQILLRLGRASEALIGTERACVINQQIGNRRGQAISHLVSGQCHKAAGGLDHAMEEFKEALRINEDIGDEKGMKICEWQIKNINQ